MNTVIEFTNVSKKFLIHYEKRARSFQEGFLNFFGTNKEPPEYVWTLRDVSFNVRPGQAVGIVGRNGAGKSTLLKLMSQIILPSRGRISIDGRVSSLLELGAGFHPDLTGRENIFLYGAILGMSRGQVRQRFDEIVGFSELNDFIDTPVRHYSSGMYLRLAFATAIHVDPDILLVDEAFAVGDHAFQQRSLNKIAAMMEAGVTVILVSHNIDVIRRHCERGIWLDKGAIRADGEVEWVLESYLENLYNPENKNSPANLSLPPRISQEAATEIPEYNDGNFSRWGTGEIEITGVEFLDERGAVRQAFTTGQTFIARLFYNASQKIFNPVFGVAIYRSDGLHVNGPNTKIAGYPIPFVEQTGYVDYHVENLNLLPGTYDFSAVVYDNTTTKAYDHQHRLYRFVIRPGIIREQFGTLYLPSHWTHCSDTEKSKSFLPTPAKVHTDV